MRRWKYLSLQKRLLIRVVIILIIGCLIWVMRGYPPLTEEGYLRRAERAHLLPEGDVLLRIDTSANGPDFLAGISDDLRRRGPLVAAEISFPAGIRNRRLSWESRFFVRIEKRKAPW